MSNSQIITHEYFFSLIKQGDFFKTPFHQKCCLYEWEMHYVESMLDINIGII